MTLTRDQIFAKRASLPRESIEVPDLGGSVLIRGLTLKEVSAVRKAAKVSSDDLGFYTRLIAVACINEDGTPVFVGEDVKLLDEISFAATDILARAIIKMNRLDEESQGPKASTPMNDSSTD